MERPRYTHDCAAPCTSNSSGCVYLGRWREFDLYACVWGDRGCVSTVIARYGNKGPDYNSGNIFAERGLIPQLVEALARAEERGLSACREGRRDFREMEQLDPRTWKKSPAEMGVAAPRVYGEWLAYKRRSRNGVRRTTGRKRRTGRKR